MVLPGTLLGLGLLTGHSYQKKAGLGEAGSRSKKEERELATAAGD